MVTFQDLANGFIPPSHVCQWRGWLTGSATGLFPDLLQASGAPTDRITPPDSRHSGLSEAFLLYPFSSQGSFHSPLCRPFPGSNHFNLLHVSPLVDRCSCKMWTDILHIIFFFSLSSSSANKQASISPILEKRLDSASTDSYLSISFHDFLSKTLLQGCLYSITPFFPLTPSPLQPDFCLQRCTETALSRAPRHAGHHTQQSPCGPVCLSSPRSRARSARPPL